MRNRTHASAMARSTTASPELRAAAAEALGRIATPKALAVLAGALGRDEDSAGELARTAVRDALVVAGMTSVERSRSLNKL